MRANAHHSCSTGTYAQTTQYLVEMLIDSRLCERRTFNFQMQVSTCALNVLWKKTRQIQARGISAGQPTATSAHAVAVTGVAAKQAWLERWAHLDGAQQWVALNRRSMLGVAGNVAVQHAHSNMWWCGSLDQQMMASDWQANLEWPLSASKLRC